MVSALLSRQVGLKMNLAKTKVVVVDSTPIKMNNLLIENVEGYMVDVWCFS